MFYKIINTELAKSKTLSIILNIKINMPKKGTSSYTSVLTIIKLSHKYNSNNNNF